MLTNLKSGFPRELFLVSTDLHLCGFCSKVLNDPHQCKKRHMFCKPCIDASLADNLITRCPSCKLAQSLKYLERNAIVKTVINDFKVKCSCAINKHVDKKCGWIGKLSQLLDRHCLFNFKQCSDCKHQIDAAEMATHREVCGHRVVSCEDCGLSITAATFKSHNLKCPEAIVDCPLYKHGLCKIADCTGSVVRKDLMFKHLIGNNAKSTTTINSVINTTNSTNTVPPNKHGDIVHYESVVRCVTPPLTGDTSPPHTITIKQTYRNFQNGFKVLWFSDGSCYAGDWLLGKKSGHGTYSFSPGGVYSGQWLNDLRHGQGRLVKKDGASYAGMWHMGKRSGHGVEVEVNGNRYEG